VADLSTQVSEYEQKCQSQEKQISELKSALTRVTENNNEMMRLLTKNVGINDLAKKLQDENDRLVDSLRKERNSVALLRSGLLMKEKEVKSLKKTIK
jgi:predicted  nucleic acid-binding Zn-ribbon protein